MIADPNKGSIIIDLAIWSSHRLRMPLFFIMSGFFTHLVLERKGRSEYLLNRLKRIMVPFLIASFILLPIVVELFAKSIVVNNDSIFNDLFSIAWANPYTIINFKLIKLAHLWFLYYLFIFSILLSTVYKTRLLLFCEHYFKENYEKSMTLVFILLLVLHFFMISPLKINPTFNLSIDLGAFIYYGMFFMWGYFLYISEVIEAIIKLNYKRYAFFAFSAAMISSLFILQYLKNDSLSITYEYLINITTALYAFFGLNALISGSLNLIKKESKVVNYLSDSSYWIYLIHVPIVILGQRLLYNVSMAPELKWVIVVCLSYMILFPSYHMIRFTFIGTYLHGKRS
jgi:peptidoglycan/LPS O-acetylase OafA/YrhL